MKKWLMILLAIFFLGKIPLEVWNQEENKDELVKAIANEFALLINCKEGTFYAIQKGDEILVFFDCQKYFEPKMETKSD